MQDTTILEIHVGSYKNCSSASYSELPNLHDTEYCAATIGKYTVKIEPTAFVPLTDIRAPSASRNLRVIANPKPAPSASVCAPILRIYEKEMNASSIFFRQAVSCILDVKPNVTILPVRRQSYKSIFWCVFNRAP